MAKTKYAKLDLDWERDPKVILLTHLQPSKSKKDAARLGWIRLICLMAEFGGSISMEDPTQAATAMQVMEMNAKQLNDFIEQCVSCGLVSELGWTEFRRVGSDRSVKDASAAERRREYCLKASIAAAKKRKEIKETESEKVSITDTVTEP